MNQLRVNIRLLAGIFFVWRFILWGVEKISPWLLSFRPDFAGPSAWANFDGVHYLTIAREGYYQYQQAFFPLYPMLVRKLSAVFEIAPLVSALAISHIAFFVGLVFFWLMIVEYDKKNILRVLLLFLLFPASFFFAAAYSEGLFFMLSALVFFALRRRMWWLAGVAGFFASLTRFFGVYLFLSALIVYFSTAQKRRMQDVFFLMLIPLGLAAYMVYLWVVVGDPLAFFHVQPAFGANMSGSELILLPQVLWRYIKIFTTVEPAAFLYRVALFEFASFIFAAYLLIKAWKAKLPLEYFVYAAFVLVTPTLTGTLSSYPRYLLAAFPAFLVLGRVTKGVQYMLMFLFGVGLVYFGAAFLRGHFVS